MLSRFGLAGTLLGAALAPVILAVVKELGRRPAEVIIARAPVPRDAGRPPRPPAPPRGLGARFARVRWRVVGATTLVALAVCVTTITLPELIAGRSVAPDRPSTFFSASPRDDAPAGAATEDADEEPAPTTTTTSTTPATATGTTTTATDVATAPAEAPPPAESAGTTAAPAPEAPATPAAPPAAGAPVTPAPAPAPAAPPTP